MIFDNILGLVIKIQHLHQQIRLAKASEHNTKAMNFILCGLSELDFVKVMHCESKKEIWDKIKNIYEGDQKFKKEKL